MSQVQMALNYAKKKHEGQNRKVSNAPYITHPIAVYNILKQHTIDENILIGAILHDTIEDTTATYEEIEYLFGEKIASIVLECTKPHDTLHSKEAVAIKLADALHNIFDNVSEKWVQRRVNMIKSTQVGRNK